MPGEGDLDVLGFTRAVAATGYNGVFSLEVFNDQFRGGSPKSISIDGYRSLVNLMDQVRRTEKDIQIALPYIPDRAIVSGFEFIEFATDENEGEELASILHAFGFELVGKHISKEVHLWKQGDINIVINTEREGFAHSSFLVHGTTVCDIGVRVDDAAATVARAKAMAARTFEQPVGLGELKIPAIRGGGGVMHFIDSKSELARVWDIEFKPVSGKARAADASLLRIDHIAQTVNFKDILSWGLFYSAIFATHKTSMVDIADSAGLVGSQVIENADGSMRVTLNGSESQHTLAGHFIAESFGSAVQHTAFQSSNIFASAHALKSNGFNLLELSKNYYDDLAARFGLDTDFLEKLSSNQILYDRDESGEFFQLYSQNFGEGFFCEIVEYRGKYSGYGSANAQFRIAAQKRSQRRSDMPKY